MTTIDTLEQLETALDSGLLEGRMTNGRWWRLRRNGQTKRWKRNPERFRLPIKAGFRVYDAFTEADLPLNSAFFRRTPNQ